MDHWKQIVSLVIDPGHILFLKTNIYSQLFDLQKIIAWRTGKIKPDSIGIQHPLNVEKYSWLTTGGTGLNSWRPQKQRGACDCLRKDPPHPTRRMLNELQSVQMSEVDLTIGLFTHYVLLTFCINLQNKLNKGKGTQRLIFGLNTASALGPFNYSLCIYKK